MTLFKSPNFISKLKTKRKSLIRSSCFKSFQNNLDNRIIFSLKKNSINKKFNKFILLAIYFSHRFKYLQQKKFEVAKSVEYFYKIKKKLNLRSHSLNYLQYKIAIKQYILVYFKLLKRLLLNTIKTKLELSRSDIKFISIIKSIFTSTTAKLLNSYKKLLNQYNLSSLNFGDIKKNLKEYIKRIFLVLILYAVPFFALLNHSLICSIPIGDNVVVNRFLARIFGRIPYLLQIFRKIFGIVDSDSKFWLLYIYYLIFPSGYQALKIPYEIAYNGTVAFSFFSFQFALELIQEYFLLPFDIYLGPIQWFYDSRFNKNIGPPSKRLYFQLYNEIVMENYFKLIQKVEDLLLIISQSIISPLTFITLCALVYNCIYYILKKKNPQILLISKTVARTMVDTKDDLF